MTEPSLRPRPHRSVGPFPILIALLAGLAVGAMVEQTGAQVRGVSLEVARAAGGLWLDALRMTVVPLVVTLLIVGVTKGAEAARTGRIALRTVGWIVVICTASAVLGAVAMPALTAISPLPGQSAEALRAGLAALDLETAPARLPGAADFVRGIIPQNVIAAAAAGEVLPLVVFSLLFALAVARLGRDRQRALLDLVHTIADALLVIVGWVLWVAPVGVFALGFVLGGTAGSAVFAGLAHYVVLVSLVGVLVTLAAYPIAIVGGRVRPGVFVRAMLAPQAVAVSTRSSLASLPAMLAAARQIGVREEVADISLPIAVALFRATGPAMNAAVVFYVAHWLGFEPTSGQVLAAVAVAGVMSYGSISLPGEISFLTSIAPIAIALGLPIAPLALFVTVEMVPDIFRTLGNVSMDVAVTTAVNRATSVTEGTEETGSERRNGETEANEDHDTVHGLAGQDS